MKGADFKQWLAAILAADVAGYSRLMTADERTTIVALDTARAVARQHIESNRGRVIDMAGDSVLAVFETANGAVTAALAIQQSLAIVFAATSEEKRLRLRIGVHLGDVIEKPDGTIYGDGVNIAARLQTLADPDGVAVSDAIRSAVRGKVDVAFIDEGEQPIKNIPYPVRAYRVRAHGLGDSAAATSVADRTAEKSIAGSALAPSFARQQLRRVLLIDDHALFREGLAELLRSVDPRLQVVHAGDGDSALAEAAAEEGIDLVLLDLHMPGSSGLSLLGVFKSKLPAVPVVVLSADETPKSVLEALDQGAMGYIPKSTTWAVMTQALRLVLAGGIYLPASVLIATRSKRPGEAPGPSTAIESAPGLDLNLQQVLRCLLLGVSKEIICRELGVVEDDIAAALGSLQVKTRTEALIEASRRGLQF